jgi:hypothetical protein
MWGESREIELSPREFAVSKKSEDLVPEEELGLLGVDTGDG